MPNKIRVGLIGAGFIANIHARGYHRISNLEVELAAVAALPLAQATEFANQYDIPECYDDYRRVLDRKDIDLIDLCVPNDLHERFAVEAAQAGKHVIIEKPLTGYFGGTGAREPVGETPKRLMLAESLKSADRILAAAERHHVKLMYAENWLYSPAIQKALSLVETSGGTILEIRAEESHSGSHASYAKAWKQAGGGALVRLGAHPAAVAIYAKQQEGLRRDGKPIRVASVTAESDDMSKKPCFRNANQWLVSDWHDVENWCTLIITFADSARAVIQASDIVLGGMKDILQVYLSNARIDCDLGHAGMLKAYAPDTKVFENEYIMEKISTKAGWTYPSIDEEWVLGYPQEMRDFCEAIAFDRAPLSDARLGREVVRVMYAAYQSAEEGQRISLD